MYASSPPITQHIRFIYKQKHGYEVERESMEEGEVCAWIKVGGRKVTREVTKWDLAKSVRREFQRVLSTFFFTSFREKMASRDLYEIFVDYGVVDEVIIPNRRNKYAHRFGFVRFFDVPDEALLASKLDNIFVGKQKLFVNVSRFHRPKGVIQLGKKPMGSLNVNQAGLRFKVGTSFKDGRSYAGVVRREAMQSETAVPKHQLAFDMVDEKAMSRFSKAFVEEVLKAGMTYKIQDVFDLEGYFGVKVTPLGARLC